MLALADGFQNNLSNLVPTTATGGNGFQPLLGSSAALASPLKGVDQNGAPLFLNTGTYLTNGGFVTAMGQHYGKDVSIDGNFDALQAQYIYAYTNTYSMPSNGWKFAGIALDCTVVNHCWSAERPCAILNPYNQMYTMWCHERDTNANGDFGVSNYFYIVATSSVPYGPYTIVTNHAEVYGFNPSDLSISLDPATSNMFLIFDGTGPIQNTNFTVQLDTNCIRASGGPMWPLQFSAAQEGPTMTKVVLGTNSWWPAMISLGEYYQGTAATNIALYWARNPTNGFTFAGSIFPTNVNFSIPALYGQGGSVPFPLPLNPSEWVFAIDNWSNGSLSNSTVVYCKFYMFDTNEMIEPLGIAVASTSFPMFNSYTDVFSFPDITGGLTNRYSFAGNVNDSVSGSNGFILPASPGTIPYTNNQSFAVNTAVQVDGTVPNVVTNLGFNINGLQPYAVNIWLRELGFVSGSRALSDDGVAVSGLNIIFQPGGATDPSVAVYDKSNTGNTLPFAWCTLGSGTNWTMYTIASDGANTATVYVNGQQVFQLSDNGNPSALSRNFTLGESLRWGSANGWKGQACLASFYYSNFTATAVAQLYRVEHGGGFIFQ